MEYPFAPWPQCITRGKAVTRDSAFFLDTEARLVANAEGGKRYVRQRKGLPVQPDRKPPSAEEISRHWDEQVKRKLEESKQNDADSKRK